MATQTIAKVVYLAAGATTINNTTLTVTSTAGVVPGAVLANANIPAGTYIVSISSATVIIMSAQATATASAQTVAATNPSIVNVDVINRNTWVNNDTLAITEGQTILVNTEQTKFWNTVNVTNGTLRIENTSTTTGIHFYMGRSASAAAANPITPANGLGKIEIAGNWIQLGVGNNGSQDFTSPFQDFIPCLWVETVPDSGDYEIWLNITSGYSQGWTHMRDGLAAIGTGKRNKFFRQLTNAEPYTNGQSIGQQFTTTLRFGEEGNCIPTNCHVRIPNIMITDKTANNYYSTASQFSNRTWWAYFNLSNGGSMTVDKALFDLSYINATQAQVFSIQNCGFSVCPLVAECYSFTANSVGITIQPTYRYNNNGTWTYSEARYWSAAWSYINNASITDLYMAANDYITTANALGGFLSLTYSTGVTINNLVAYCVNKMPRGAIVSYGHNVFYGGYLKDCTFTNMNNYGGGIYFTNTSNCTMNGINVSDGMFNEHVGVASGQRFGVDPNTGAALVANTPYYFKVRSYHNYWDINDYYENPIVYSATPYGGHKAGRPQHPFWFGAQLKPNAGNWDIVLNWMQAPSPLVTFGTVAYEIYRGTSSGFTARDATTKLYTTATAATITITDNGAQLLGRVANNTTYYYIIRKYNSGFTVASCTGSNGGYTLTTSNNFNTARGNVTGCDTVNGSAKITSVASNFIGSGLIPGMKVTGAGIPANTTIVSVDSNFEMILSNEATATAYGITLTFGVAVGMAVTGTNIALGAKIQSVDSNTQITLDKAHTGAVSATATISDFTESAEQIVIVPNYLPVYPNWKNTTNMCLQSGDANTTWTKTTCTVTANSKLSPLESIIGTATGDTLGFTAATGSLTQAITTVAGTNYTFSVYLCSLIPTGITADIKCGTAVTNCSLTQKWQRFSVTFQATGTSTTVGIYATAISTMYCSLMCMEASDSMNNPTQTTTAAATTVAYQEITLRAWSKGSSNGAGIQIDPTAAPTHTLWSEIFMGTTSDFTPSKSNMVGTTLNNGTMVLQLNLCNDNDFKNLTKDGYGGLGSAYFLHLTSSSGNRFINFNYDMNFTVNAPIYLVNLSNNNIIHNWNVGKLRSFIASGFLVNTANNNSGLLLENIVAEEYDNPISNQSLDTIVKGCAGVDTILATLGNGTDGINTAYVTVYDTIFNEYYISANKGAMVLLFNASSKAIKPYTITGTAVFANNGGLYFNAPGDSIIYEVPHKIYGVSGFTNREPLVNTVDLGNNVITAKLLLKEYCLNTGSGYGSWKVMTPANLSGETVSASNGFNMKIRLTARNGIKFDGQTNGFVGNEAINGQTSGTTANVIEVQDEGTVGTLVLTDVSGNGFLDNENIRVGTTAYAVVNGAFLYPQPTSYINGLQIYTEVDQSVKYPIDVIYKDVSITNLVSGTEIHIYRTSDMVELASTESSGTTYTWNYLANDTNIYITITKPGYKWIRFNNLTLSSSGINIIATQQADLGYSNPA